MLAYFDDDQEALLDSMARYHPWTTTIHTPDGRYVDFKAHPEQIAEVLEDLEGRRDSAIAKSVVDLLTWANGPDVPYETNDFALGAIRANTAQDVNPHGLELVGRVTVLFRDLWRNCHVGVVEMFTRELLRELQRIDPDFRDGCVSVCRWPHGFTDLVVEGQPAEGVCFLCQFWAWGDNEQAVYAAADRALSNLRAAMLAVWPTVKG